MKYYYLIVPLTMLTTIALSQDSLEEFDDDEHNTEVASIFAVGSLVIALFMGVLVKHHLAAALLRKPWSDYPNCGLREDGIVEPELCRADCIWRDTTASIKETTTVMFGRTTRDVTVIVEPLRVPVDYSCLDDCPIIEQGVTYNPLFDLCMACDDSTVARAQNLKSNGSNRGLYSTVACQIISRMVAKERCYFEHPATCPPGTAANIGVINRPTFYFIPQTEDDELFALCLMEQEEKGISWGDYYNPLLTTTSTYCCEMLGIRYVGNPTTKEGRIDRLNKADRRRGEKVLPAEELFNIYDGQASGLNEIAQRAYSKSKTPWLCSLKEAGFRGRHRCGVTLLSGPPQQSILVSAAHCTHVCRDPETDLVLETCCCRDENEGGSCKQTTSYCGSGRQQMYEARPYELNIVCGEFSTEAAPEGDTPENEVVLNIRKITPHPDYINGKPIEGNDIAVYHISNPEVLEKGIKKKFIYPACLPRDSEAKYTDKGRFAAWEDPEPQFKSAATSLDKYALNNFFIHQYNMEPTVCEDPEYMQSMTYYPQGTVCYREPSRSQCVTFGNSGSPIMRKFSDNGTERFAWIGPLSISKGCDKTTTLKLFQNRYKKEVPVYHRKSLNPAVFTDGRCYLDWIAKQYGMKAPVGWRKPASCSNGGTGDKEDRNQADCYTHLDTKCDFSSTQYPECKLQAEEGFSYNIYKCLDTKGNIANCANNCKGVDPNAIVIGGLAVGFASAVAASTFLGPAAALGGAGAVGTAAMMNRMCPPGYCRPRGSDRCCLLQIRRGRIRCPRSCTDQ